MFKNLFILSLAILAVNSKFLQQADQVPQFQHTNLTDYFLVAEGFATTVGIYAEMPALEKCKAQDSDLVQKSVDLIQDIVNGENSTIVDEIKDVIDSLYVVYKQCDFKGLKAEFLQGLADMKANFTQPDYMKKFLSQLQSNIFQLMADLKTVIDKFNAGDMASFGQGMGNLMRTLLIVKA